jgi:hypothetical protein
MPKKKMTKEEKLAEKKRRREKETAERVAKQKPLKEMFEPSRREKRKLSEYSSLFYNGSKLQT